MKIHFAWAMACTLPPTGGLPLWGVWVAVGVAGLLALGAVLWRRRQKKKTTIGSVADEFGFAYDPQQKIFYSTIDAWQRQFGYCRLYDESAPALGMIIDCEPVRFEYAGRHWLIEFWKGQYGMTTGAEVGVYSTDGPELAIPGLFDGTFYGDTDQLLQMSLQLYKNSRPLFTRSGSHWWQTGFVPGEFSRPEELTIRARLVLRDPEMKAAFVEALEGLGYGGEDMKHSGSTVYLSISQPRSSQPATRTPEVEQLVQENNRRMCQAFQALADGAEDIEGQVDTLRREYPKLYRKLVGSARPSALYAPYQAIRKYLG